MHVRRGHEYECSYAGVPPKISYWTDIKSAVVNNFDFESKRTLTE